MLPVEAYDRVRQMVLVEGKSQRTVSRELGYSRNTIRKMLALKIPPGYRRTKGVGRPAIDPVRGIIDAWLEDDRHRPPKQRHTAFRIFERLRDDHGFSGSYSAVQRYVAHRRATGGEVFLPLQFGPGEEAQVDWGEGWVIDNGVLRKLFFFCMRLCYSTASFVQAYERENQESFLDGHVRAFEFFGGVPRRLAYDNLKSAVIAVGKGQERKLTRRFLELKSWYLFAVRFCNVRRGNEKGHAENLVKHTQRTFLTPVPDMTGRATFNAHLLKQCRRDLDRTVRQRGGKTRRELLEEERPAFLPLPETAFEACRGISTFADKFSLIRFDTNDYSVPVSCALHPVVLKGFVDQVELFVNAERVASHERCYGSGQFVLDYRHYLPLLERKPGGIHNGRPFKGEPWGEDLERFRRELEFRYEGEGTRKFIRVLLLFTEFPEKDVKAAVRTCLRRCAFSDEAVRGVLTHQPHPPPRRLDLRARPWLAAVQSALPPASRYDRLVEKEVGV